MSIVDTIFINSKNNNFVVPDYARNIYYIIQQSDVQTMISRAKLLRDMALVSVFYLTGARPVEVQQLKFSNIMQSGVNTIITVKTAKLKKENDKSYLIDERKLEFIPSTPFLDIIHKYRQSQEAHKVHSVSDGASCNELMFKLSLSRIKHIVYELSEGLGNGESRKLGFCPYVFRHSRMYKMSDSGAGIADLMNWKGAKDMRSAERYLRNKPIGKNFKIE